MATVESQALVATAGPPTQEAALPYLQQAADEDRRAELARRAYSRLTSFSDGFTHEMMGGLAIGLRPRPQGMSIGPRRMGA